MSVLKVLFSLLFMAMSVQNFAFAEQNYVPINMDKVTVFALSQTGTYDENPQIEDLKPDMNIREWQKWNIWGTKFSDYNFNYIARLKKSGILTIGGMNTTAYFRDEAANNAEFESIAGHNARGEIVAHDYIVPGCRRASLANPTFRNYLVKIAKLQIDGGMDGLCFDEANSSYVGTGFDGNEGFDDYHLADFNAYLINKYPAATDWKSKFGMSDDNIIHPELPANDLQRNFNYRRYLISKGWSKNPFNPENPLATEWGRIVINRSNPKVDNFTEYYFQKVYWKDIIDQIRDYAAKQGKQIYITANGIIPYVDFQCIGLYDGNKDSVIGKQVDYMPVINGHLDGKRSLLPAYNALKERSIEVAGDVPVVLFTDWPGETLNRYISMPFSERCDFWRIYAAEAYANGMFYAFHLKTTTGEPTAAAQGMMPLFKQLSSFYKNHAELFHQVKKGWAEVNIGASNITYNLMEKQDESKKMLHLVNHNYNNKLLPVEKFTVTVAADQSPSAVRMVSPDVGGSENIAFTYKGGKIQFTVPTLTAYDIIIME